MTPLLILILGAGAVFYVIGAGVGLQSNASNSQKEVSLILLGIGTAFIIVSLAIGYPLMLVGIGAILILAFFAFRRYFPKL
jgi:predicted MFS family arabinose efflux permease